MKIFKLLLLFCSLSVIVAGCKQDTLAPMIDDGHAPGAIKAPLVENIPGGAKITYTLPDDLNLLYVRADYEVNGIKKEAKASFYQKSLVVEGYADTAIHHVKLYAVSRSEKASAPVEVSIKPLISSLIKVRKSLTFKESFGGFSTRFVNEDKANMVIGALLWNEDQREWRQIDANYTSLEAGKFNVRGLQPVLQKFGLYVRDRWGNLSDTLKFELVPIYEIELDKKKFLDLRKKHPIPQMAPVPVSGAGVKEFVDYNSTYVWKNLFDGNTSSMFHTKQNVDQPAWLPIDLGVNARLSRYKLWQRSGSTWAFNHGNPHKWEIWGTNTPADVNSWVKLDEQIMIKPSGLPLNQNSNEDNELGVNGQEYEFPEDVPAVRYVAWKAIDCWGAVGGATGFFHLFELSFYGQVK